MQQAFPVGQEVREDLFFGQVAIIVSRWFLIATGVILVLWSADKIDQIPVPIALMIVLTAMNFYLHGRYLVERPVNATLVYLTSGIDLVIVLAMVAVWQGPGTQLTAWGPGLRNPLFVLLYPTILAFGLVFPPRITLVYSAVTIVLYALVVAVVGLGADGNVIDPRNLGAQKELFQRVVTLAGTAGLATYYWRIQRERHRKTEAARETLLQDVESLTSSPAPVG